MKDFVAVAFLLAPSSYLGMKHWADYGELPKPSLSNLVGSFVLGVYILLILILGAATIYNPENLHFIPRELQRFLFFYLLPGLGFGILLFPMAAAEYSQSYGNLLRLDWLPSYAIVGWALLLCSGLYVGMIYGAA